MDSDAVLETLMARRLLAEDPRLPAQQSPLENDEAYTQEEMQRILREAALNQHSGTIAVETTCGPPTAQSSMTRTTRAAIQRLSAVSRP